MKKKIGWLFYNVNFVVIDIFVSIYDKSLLI